MSESDSLSPVDPALLPEINAIRIETVLSRYPVHNLSKKNQININIHRQDDLGETRVLWKVAYSESVGIPRQLSYKLDTLVVARAVDEATRPLVRKGGRRPLPEAIPVGSFNHICRELGVNPSGNMRRQIREAFDANIGALIKAHIKYKGSDGSERELRATFNRYGIVERGEKLPTGETADCTYIVFHPIYREVLNNAPMRPLDWEYMKTLPPGAQRFYEILSLRIFIAIRYKYKVARIRYSEYCMYSAQQRCRTLEQAHSQMSKLHKPHVEAGYIRSASFSATEASGGLPDWEISYVPGPKAEAEYRTFNNRQMLDAAAMEPKQVGEGKSPGAKGGPAARGAGGPAGKTPTLPFEDAGTGAARGAGANDAELRRKLEELSPPERDNLYHQALAIAAERSPAVRKNPGEFADGIEQIMIGLLLGKGM